MESVAEFLARGGKITTEEPISFSDGEYSYEYAPGTGEVMSRGKAVKRIDSGLSSEIAIIGQFYGGEISPL